MQFAASSYYHFVMEVVPRVLMLRPVLEKQPEMRLIVPKDTSSNKFITAYLALFEVILTLTLTLTLTLPLPFRGLAPCETAPPLQSSRTTGRESTSKRALLGRLASSPVHL